jgi:peptidoglycan/LPS O-acetylase OafA/YrhL
MNPETLVLKVKYRQEIDGLRALAVIAVILNHMSKDVLPSGYLGVDVFFVISGYVISSSLHKRSHSSIGELLLDFYARRVKRLIPTLVFFVAITSIIISLFNPAPAITLKTGLASLFGLSNLYLISQATDYFGDSAQLNVFTHTWSLGVEEQFYIIFPCIVWFTASGRNGRKGYKHYYALLGILAIASLAAFIYLSITKPYFAYYLMPTRFWELAAGAFAFWINPNMKIANNTVFLRGLSWFSIVMMLMVFFAPEQYTIITTICIVALTVLLILSTQPETIGFKIFASKPLVYTGLISYSLYLWHWSVLSISRWTIGIHLWTAPLQAALMLFLAATSYHYIENPLRKANWSKHGWITIGYGIATMAAASVLLLLLAKPLNGLLYTGKLPYSMAASHLQSLTYPYSISGDQFRWQGEKCVLSDNNQVGKIIPIIDCTLGDFENAKTRVIVIGDSFSAAFVQAFDQLVLKDKYSVTITSSWGASPVKELPNNNPWSKANYYYWESVVPKLLSRLRAGDWVFMVNDMTGFSPKETSTENANKLEALRKGLEIFSNDLARREVNLAILHGNPFAREANCEPAARVKQWFTPFGVPCTFITKEETIKRRSNLHNLLTSLGNQKKITVVDLLDIFCPEEICSYQAKNGDILYRDVWSHPSIEGVRLSAPVIRRALNPVAFSSDQILEK